jgi:hypothetical protein
VKGFADYLFYKKTNEDIFIGQGTHLQDPIPGTQIKDTDLSPKEKVNKFKKKSTQRPK